MSLILPGPHGPIEWAQFGRGEPTTVFAHGLAGSIAGTRPFGSGVPGRRVFFHFMGHRSVAVAPDSPRLTTRSGAAVGEAAGGPTWTYAGLADELAAVSDHTGADRALGVSLGAGAVLQLLTRRPARFSRAVLVLPAAVDQPRSAAALAHFGRLADLVDARDAEGVAAALTETYGAEAALGRWAVDQAQRLLETDVATALRRLPGQVPVAAWDELADISTPVLVIAQQGDPVHPVDTARALVDALPDARLVAFPEGGLLGAHRARLRALVGEFLGG